MVFGDRETFADDIDRRLLARCRARARTPTSEPWLRVLDDQLPHLVGAIAGALVTDDPKSSATPSPGVRGAAPPRRTGRGRAGAAGGAARRAAPAAGGLADAGRRTGRAAGLLSHPGLPWPERVIDERSPPGVASSTRGTLVRGTCHGRHDLCAACAQPSVPGFDDQAGRHRLRRRPGDLQRQHRPPAGAHRAADGCRRRHRRRAVRPGGRAAAVGALRRARDRRHVGGGGRRAGGPVVDEGRPRRRGARHGDRAGRGAVGRVRPGAELSAAPPRAAASRRPGSAGSASAVATAGPPRRTD